MVTPLAGICAAVPAATEVVHARGCGVSSDDASAIPEAVALARGADAAIVCLGGRSGLVAGCTSGEFRDAASLDLTGRQQQLVDQVAATGTPTVVVLLNGRVLSIPALAAHVPAIVEAWLPGEEGGHAIADVLFGAVSPSGRLPVSMPRDVGQVPLYHSRKWASGKVIVFDADYVDLASTPLFAFGHGLSYTRFEYDALAISPAAAAATGTPVEISLAVRNAGTRAGAEVVQLYVQDVVASVTRPLQQLAGFARIELAPGETRRIRFTLDASQLAFYDRAMRFVVEPGEFRIRVGARRRTSARGLFPLRGRDRSARSARGPPDRGARLAVRPSWIEARRRRKKARWRRSPSDTTSSRPRAWTMPATSTSPTSSVVASSGGRRTAP
jgi:beta-glucosidase